MRGYGIFYYIAEALRGLRANSLVNLLAVGTISMAMLIVGFFLILFFNIRATVNTLSDKLIVSAYLKEGLTPHEKDFLQSRLRTEPGVKKADFVSKDEALARFKKELQGQESLIQNLGENPLPDSFELVIDRRYAESGRLEALVKKISSAPGVEDVSYGRKGAEVVATLYRLLTYGGTALALLLGISVVFIISNSVRLALYSRGQEIELMQWIGATRGFIQGPFLIEGAILSMTGSALAVGVLAAIFYSLPPDIVLFLSRSNSLDFLPPQVVAYMIGGGGMLGLAGGLISVNKFME
ncbi:MAG TPA: permease-like cell division protein FtsX [Nitrospirota bacterium]|nr:permease-like cell division protein FtsX [Nitrospirota bacterium]